MNKFFFPYPVKETLHSILYNFLTVETSLLAGTLGQYCFLRFYRKERVKILGPCIDLLPPRILHIDSYSNDKFQYLVQIFCNMSTIFLFRKVSTNFFWQQACLTAFLAQGLDMLPMHPLNTGSQILSIVPAPKIRLSLQLLAGAAILFHISETKKIYLKNVAAPAL